MTLYVANDMAHDDDRNGDDNNDDDYDDVNDNDDGDNDDTHEDPMFTMLVSKKWALMIMVMSCDVDYDDSYSKAVRVVLTVPVNSENNKFVDDEKIHKNLCQVALIKCRLWAEPNTNWIFDLNSSLKLLLSHYYFGTNVQ